jgi:lysozyme family protein
MANWDTAYNWMMDNVDPQHACAQVSDTRPGGVAGPGFAISGISLGAWPAEFAAIAAADQASREPLIQKFYQNHFWNYWLAQLNSDELCKRVFDFAVAGGSTTSVRCLQLAVNSFTLSDPLVVDGEWGPKTVAATNACNPLTLVAAFQRQRIAYYQAIVDANPAKAKYLAAWIARARK